MYQRSFKGVYRLFMYIHYGPFAKKTEHPNFLALILEDLFLNEKSDFCKANF